jgi:hypothetical protein
MVVFILAELRDLIQLLCACHQPVTADEILQGRRVDARLRLIMAAFNDGRLQFRREQRNLERRSASNGGAQWKS